jgi:hypothetical protein
VPLKSTLNEPLDILYKPDIPGGARVETIMSGIAVLKKPRATSPAACIPDSYA